MSSTGSTSKLFLALASLLLVLPAVEAMDAGDTIAFLLGLAVSVIGFCACLAEAAKKASCPQTVVIKSLALLLGWVKVSLLEHHRTSCVPRHSSLSWKF
uniref:Uncharacterized protein n=1 Tax=Anser brachyrhynchus TaxID=132585 RepID=A0A8B9BM45_9AVES